MHTSFPWSAPSFTVWVWWLLNSIPLKGPRSDSFRRFSSYQTRLHITWQNFFMQSMISGYFRLMHGQNFYRESRTGNLKRHWAWWLLIVSFYFMRILVGIGVSPFYFLNISNLLIMICRIPGRQWWFGNVFSGSCSLGILIDCVARRLPFSLKFSPPRPSPPRWQHIWALCHSKVLELSCFFWQTWFKGHIFVHSWSSVRFVHRICLWSIVQGFNVIQWAIGDVFLRDLRDSQYHDALDRLFLVLQRWSLITSSFSLGFRGSIDEYFEYTTYGSRRRDSSWLGSALGTHSNVLM